MIINEKFVTHREAMVSLDASVQLETGPIYPYVSIISLSPRVTSKILKDEFLTFLRNFSNANVVGLDNTLYLGSTAVNEVFFNGDTNQSYIKNNKLIIPSENLLLGAWLQDNTRKRVRRIGLNSSCGIVCNNLCLFCPSIDYPYKPEMEKFLLEYYSKFNN